MTSDEEARRQSEAMVAFESSLADVVLGAFARGARIEGDWRIEPGVRGAPGWLVTVSKIEPSGESGYDCSMLDE